MSSVIILPNLNYDRLTYDQVFCYFYGKSFKLNELHTLDAIIKKVKELNPTDTSELEKMESWFSTLRRGFVSRGEL